MWRKPIGAGAPSNNSVTANPGLPTSVRVRQGRGVLAKSKCTSRFGGVSVAPYANLNLGLRVGDDLAAVMANRAELAARCELSPDRLVFMHQVHGREVAVVDKPIDEVDGVDALVTSERGLGIVVLVADCVPVLLGDAGAGVVGVAHAGRKGVVAGIVPATVEAMLECGARPGEIHARFGPSICGACYEVPQELQDEVANAVPGTRTTTRAGTPGLDLWAGIRGQLAALGVAVADGLPTRCTYEDQSFFSYRRDGLTGRQAGVAWLPA